VTRLFSPGRLAAAGAALLVLVGVILVFAPSNSYVFLPGDATAVAPIVRAEGETPDDDGGGIYFVTAIVREATLFERLFPRLHEGATIVAEDAVLAPGESDDERRRNDLRAMRESQDVAAAVALRELGYDVDARPTGVRIVGFFARVPAMETLRQGDIIVTAQGRKTRTPNDLRKAVTQLSPGEQVTLELRDDDGLETVRVETIENPQVPGRAAIGILSEQAAEIRLPIDVEIDSGRVGGPSAGLPFALDILEELGEDVDRGHRVAATGTIDLDGNVGPVGGVKQKTIGARRAGVDILLVPAGENAREARQHADGLRVVAVETFPQALRVLATLRPRRQH
jgi:PDZ domain-containing protein